MKIAISYPPLESSKGIPLLSQNRQFQWFNKPTYIYPMLPAYAATLLRENGFEVIWDDGIAEGKSFARWLEDIRQNKPDLVVLESKTPVIKIHWQIIHKLKQIPDWNPLVILVGDHVTALPEESLINSAVDYVLTGGDYDFLLLNLCRYLTNKQSQELKPGIYYREDVQIKNTGPFQLNHNIDTLPIIDRDLTHWQLYSEKNGNYKRLPGTYIMAGRDCWYHRCTFCSWTTLYPRYRTRNPQSVLDEVGLLLDKYGVREIMDDTGCFPVGDWLKEFCEGMITRGYHKRVSLNCNMRFGALTPQMYKLMKKAGFRFILYGLESANQKTLDRINKGIKVEQIIESCKWASQAGLSPHLTIMFGYPWEDKTDVQNTVNLGCYLMKKGYAHTLQSTMIIPYPGTPLFAECQENGWLTVNDWEYYDMRQLVMYTPVGEAGIKQAIRMVYKVAFSPRFIWHRLISIRSWEDLRFLYRGGKKLLGHLMDFETNKEVKECQETSLC
jgi:anaerobic magnesium-protoporphyrin IX monomethyl ester cyclase